VIIDNNIIYRHKVLRVNYTTYDMRRAQDSLNPRVPPAGHSNIMVLSPENEEENNDPHPYWYARLLEFSTPTFVILGLILNPESRSKWISFLFVGLDVTRTLNQVGKQGDSSAWGLFQVMMVLRLGSWTQTKLYVQFT
jgi:hypothetical protein